MAYICLTYKNIYINRNILKNRTFLYKGFSKVWKCYNLKMLSEIEVWTVYFFYQLTKWRVNEQERIKKIKSIFGVTTLPSEQMDSMMLTLRYGVPNTGKYRQMLIDHGTPSGRPQLYSAARQWPLNITSMS